MYNTNNKLLLFGITVYKYYLIHTYMRLWIYI